MAKSPGLGVIAIDVIDATVRAAVPLTPLKVAVMVVDPEATALASPLELTVAVAVLELDQFAVLLTFAVEPSL